MSLAEYYHSTPRDLYNVVRAFKERTLEELEEQYNQVRLIMWASIVAMNGNTIKPEQLIQLKRDIKVVKLSEFVKQEIAAQSKNWDAEMGL